MDQGLHLADARYKIVRSLLALASGSSPPSGLSSIWHDVAPGTTITPNLTQDFLSLDTTGAAIVVNLTATPFDGQDQLVKNEGVAVGVAPVINAQGAGITVEQVASASLAGTFGPSTSLPNPGQVVWLKYDGAVGQKKWKVIAVSYGAAPSFVFANDLATSTPTHQWVSGLSGANGGGGSIPLAPTGTITQLQPGVIGAPSTGLFWTFQPLDTRAIGPAERCGELRAQCRTRGNPDHSTYGCRSRRRHNDHPPEHPRIALVLRLHGRDAHGKPHLLGRCRRRTSRAAKSL